MFGFLTLVRLSDCYSSFFIATGQTFGVSDACNDPTRWSVDLEELVELSHRQDTFSPVKIHSRANGGLGLRLLGQGEGAF